MKKSYFILPALSLLALASCAMGGTTATSSSVIQRSISSETLDLGGMLDFMEGSKVLYFEFNLQNDIADKFVKVGDEDVTAKAKKVIATEGKTISFGGTNAGKIDIYLAVATKKETATGQTKIDTEVRVSKGLRAGMLTKFGTESTSFRNSIANAEKIFITITDKDKGWDHNLSDKLNSGFEQYMASMGL